MLTTSCSIEPSTPFGSSKPIEVVKPKSWEANDASDFGYILAVVGVTTHQPTSGLSLTTDLGFINKDSSKNERLTVSYFRASTEYDYESEHYAGRMVLERVPVGNYEFDSITFHGMDGQAHGVTTSTSKPIGVKFKVEKGKVVYLGRFTTSCFLAQNLVFRFEYPSYTGWIDHSFNEKDDYDLALKKYSAEIQTVPQIKKASGEFKLIPMLIPLKQGTE